MPSIRNCTTFPSRKVITRPVGRESTAYPRVASSIPGKSHTIMEIDYGIMSSPHSNDSRRVVVSYKRKYVHEVLVNHLVTLAQEKVLLGELTI